MQSTARESAAMYRRLQAEKALVPCVHLARGVFLVGMVLQSVASGDGEKNGGKGSWCADACDGVEDEDVVFAKGVLEWFCEEGVCVAGRLRGELEER